MLLSSHILSEVERLGDRATIVRDGRVVETGRLSDLRHLRRTRVVATLAGATPDVAHLAGVHDVVAADGRVSCSVDPDGLAGLLALLTDAGVTSLSSAQPSLEELSLDAYRDRAGAGR